MMMQMKWPFCVAVLMAVLFAGCTSPGGSDSRDPVYTQQWAYGPGYADGDRLPVFEDSFDVEGSHELAVVIDWNIQEGHAAVVLTPPHGEAVNLTDEETGGPRNGDERTINGTAGPWGIRISTWRDSDGEFPEGAVVVRVVVA